MPSLGIEIPDETAEKLKHVKDVVECLADKLDVAQWGHAICYIVWVQQSQMSY